MAITESRTTIVGISTLARKMGVTRQHIWRVAHGKRESKRISAALTEAGVNIKNTGVKQ